MKKDKIDWRIVIVAIVCITLIELMALAKGLNGVLLTAVIGVIAACAGIAIPSQIIKK